MRGKGRSINFDAFFGYLNERTALEARYIMKNRVHEMMSKACKERDYHLAALALYNIKKYKFVEEFFEDAECYFAAADLCLLKILCSFYKNFLTELFVRQVMSLTERQECIEYLYALRARY